MVTRQLLVKRRTAKARQSKTNVLPLSHGTKPSAKLKPSASKTISSVFHLHNTSATCELSVYLDGQCLWHEYHPTYLGVTLDRTLSYREHLTHFGQSGHALLTLSGRCAVELYHASHLWYPPFYTFPTLNYQPYEGRLPLTSLWRKSSNMIVGQSSLISLATIATTDIQEATVAGLATS